MYLPLSFCCCFLVGGTTTRTICEIFLESHISNSRAYSAIKTTIRRQEKLWKVWQTAFLNSKISPWGPGKLTVKSGRILSNKNIKFLSFFYHLQYIIMWRFIKIQNYQDLWPPRENFILCFKVSILTIKWNFCVNIYHPLVQINCSKSLCSYKSNFTNQASSQGLGKLVGKACYKNNSHRNNTFEIEEYFCHRIDIRGWNV